MPSNSPKRARSSSEWTAIHWTTATKSSTFHFTIQAEPTDLPRRYLQPGEASPLQGKRLLIVDDNATNRKILRLQAHSWGMETDECAGAAEALQLIERGVAYDVGILD